MPTPARRRRPIRSNCNPTVASARAPLSGRTLELVGYGDIGLGVAMFLVGDRIVDLGIVAGALSVWQAAGLFGALMGAATVVLGRALAAKARHERRDRPPD